MRAPILGLAVGSGELIAARRSARTTPETAWRCSISLGTADAGDWRDELRSALAEMQEALEIRNARLAVTLLPPLVQIRTLTFPRLRLAEVRRVMERDIAKYFPGVREPQVVALAPVPGARRGPLPVLVASAPAWLLDGISDAARSAGCTIDSFEPAHSGWARWAGREGRPLVVVEDGERAELIRVERGRLIDVRRTPTSTERIDAAILEMGGGGQSVFNESELGQAAAIAACYAGGGGALSLVPGREAAARVGRTRRLALRLWIAAAAGVVLALGLHRAVLLRELNVLARAREIRRTAIEAALSEREASLGALARLGALSTTASEAHSWSAILNEVASGLPADAYLTSLRGTADSLVLDGGAQRAAGVFEGLQSASRLTAVRPAGPIRQEVRDSGPPIERFTASATLRSPPRAPEKAP